nr:large ribosomal subunit protein bL20m-like [Dasypus novemcinctus]
MLGCGPALRRLAARAAWCVRCRGAAARFLLTTQPWLRKRPTDRSWRVQEVLKRARHFRGRKNRRYKSAVRAAVRAFVKCAKARALKKRSKRTLWINRGTAASQEHGRKYSGLVSKCQVELNRKVLADLAIYERKTSKSLAAFAKRRREEGSAAALGKGKESESIFSRVVHLHCWGTPFGCWRFSTLIP